uniref:Uncharacterized protein n=1 Tax=Rhizophagus irregularis (strain DAOM 181602 / DAOM 197198 / MUCL 43194) TaxID=747089 RepID=U9UDW1_RHIID
MVARRFFTDSRSGYGAGWVTYSIVDFTIFEIYLGGVAVVIYIERVLDYVLFYGRLFVLVLVNSALCCDSFLNTWYSIKLLMAKINKIQAIIVLSLPLGSAHFF